MEERLITLVKENTRRGDYEDNNASNLSNIIGLSRNSISSYLNDYFNQGRFVKINTRPVLFLEKSEIHRKIYQNSSFYPVNSFTALQLRTFIIPPAPQI